MEMQMQCYEVSQLFHSFHDQSFYSSPFTCNETANKQSIEELLPENIYPSPNATTKPKQSPQSLENTLIKCIIRDDKLSLIQTSKQILSSSSSSSTSTSTSTSSSSSTNSLLDRNTMSKLLHLCCEFDAVNSAEALINGEINGGDVIPLINEIDGCSGLAPLHTAAENHALGCVELLVRKRGRTDMRTKPKAGNNSSSNSGGSGNWKGLLPLELALRSSRMEVNWEIDQPLDDLLLLLSEKDLGAIRVLSEKTKEVGEVAYTLAIEGRVAALTALLMVAAEKVNGSVLEMRNSTDLAVEKMTVFSCVIKEAVAIFVGSRGKDRVAEESKKDIDDVADKRRKILLKEMELFNFFGASPVNNGCMDKKAISPLIIASQAGDEAVMKLLLQTGANIAETDAEGNSALHWCLKASKVSTPEHIRILRLLLKHGARVRQKDKLGLTAVHLAAANGNLEALQILLSNDPDGVYVTSELKETPLFFAAKNEFIECAKLLMSYGATTEVFNLRRERPIDLAKSQDLRATLSRTSVVITNRVSQQKYTACIHNDQVVSETCEALMKEACSTSESVDSSADSDICKYYGSATGCARGSKCFYRHGEEELCASKSRAGSARATVLAEFKRKVFVGGLPPTLDSDSLSGLIEEQFGPITDCHILKMEIEDQVLSRGFGFVTFKHEKSVAAALNAHYINIWGKKVEIKSAVPKWLLSQEDNTDEPQQERGQQESAQYPTQAQYQSEQSSREELPEKLSWAERVGQVHPDDIVNEPKPRRTPSAGQNVPVWLITFKKWLPKFLRKMTKNTVGEYYSLSSLKSDFKSIFGLELDHASIGYSKLSDFIKAFPELCRVKVVHTGGQVPNHMVLLPNEVRPPPLVVPRKPNPVTRQATPGSKHGDDAICENPGLPRNDTDSDTQSEITSEPYCDATNVNKVHRKTENLAPSLKIDLDYSRLLQFLQPDPVFLARTWLGTGGYKVPDEQFRRKHLILEALAQKRKQVFFLRDHNFYNDYATSLKQGNCFACGNKKMLWANYPCEHMLWCGDCKLVAMRIAAVGTSTHKCVMCDQVVNKIDLIPWTRRQQQQSFEDTEFPPIHDAFLRSHRVHA